MRCQRSESLPVDNMSCSGHQAAPALQMMKRKHRHSAEAVGRMHARAILQRGMMHNPHSACLAQVPMSFYTLHAKAFVSST